MRTRIALIALFMMGMLAVGITLGVFRPQGEGHIAESMTPEITQDIGARLGQGAEIAATSFIPSLTTEKAIALGLEVLKINLKKDPEKLPVKATVAKYTGVVHGDGPGGFVQDLKVWVVVFDDYPAWPRGIFVPSGGERPSYKDPRYTVVLDDETGDLVYSALTWERVDRE